MNHKILGLLVISTLIFALSFNVSAQGSDPACTWPQADPNDVVGASKTQTPEKVLEAIRLVKEGAVYRLAHDYDETNIPLPFGRQFDVTVFTFELAPAPAQAFKFGIVSGEIGQLGTQFDAIGHAGHTSGYYNCLSPEEVGPDAEGRLQVLGVESVKPFFTRGVLLDFVKHSSAPKMIVNGQTMLVDSYLITLADLREVLERQGVGEPGEGDVVAFYTGWDSLFGIENERFAFSPGPGIEVAEWLASRKVALVGADTQAVEAIDGNVSVELVSDPLLLGEDIGPVFNALHFILITQNGIHLLENMRLSELAADLHAAFVTDRDPFGQGFVNGRGGPYEFLFTFAPVPITGLAGSPGQPLAIR